MPLVKRRPKIKLYVPSEVVPGKSFVASVIVEARRAVPIDWLEIELEGWARIRSATTGTCVLAQRARLADAGELSQGTSRFDCRFEIPTHAAPTYRGRSAWVEYVARVQASIPWWPDARQSFEVIVRPAPTPSREPLPALYSSAPEGPVGKLPHAELSLADTAVTSGGFLKGAVALGNVSYSGYTGVDVSLVATERLLRPGFDLEHELMRVGIRLALPDPLQESQPLAFAMRLPEIPPTQSTELFAVTWAAEVCARRRFGKNLELGVPIVVLARAADERSERERRAPPVVGSDRLARVWQAVGEPLGLTLDGSELTGDVEGVHVRVYREHRGRAGLYLMAELRFASLHLGLDGGLRTGFRRVLSDGVPIGDGDWDARHYLVATDEGQARAFAKVVGPALAKARVADLSDEIVRLEQRSAGLNTEPLGSLVRAALDIARSIARARGVIPPPAGFALEPWQALARSLDGELETARMVVSGALEGQRVEVATEWSERAPIATRVTLAARSALSPRYRQTLLPGASGVTAVRDGEPAAPDLPDEGKRLVGALLQRGTSLTLDANEVVLLLPAPLADAQPVAALLPELASLGEVCAGKQSAYR